MIDVACTYYFFLLPMCAISTFGELDTSPGVSRLPFYGSSQETSSISSAAISAALAGGDIGDAVKQAFEKGTSHLSLMYIIAHVY